MKEFKDLLDQYNKIKGYSEGGTVQPQVADFEEGDTILGAVPKKLSDVEEPNENVDPQYLKEDLEAIDNLDDEDQENEDNIASSDTDETEPTQSSQNLGQDNILDKKNLVADNSPLSRLLSKIQPKKSLEQAQQERQQSISGNQIMKGLTLASSGLSHTNPDRALKLLDEQDKYANLPVQEYNELTADQSNDPNSTVSQVMKQYLQSKGFTVPEGSSAKDILTVAPFLAKDQALQNALTKTLLNIQSRQSEGALNRDQRDSTAKMHDKAYRERTAAQIGSTNERKMQSRWDAYAKALREGGGPVVNQNRQDFLRASKIFIDAGLPPSSTAKELEKLPPKELNKLNRIQVIEAALGVNKYFSGQGVPAQATLDKLIPNNLNMKSSDIQNYVTSKLTPAQQADVMKAYLSIAARGRDYAKTNLDKHMNLVSSQGADVFQHYPEQTKFMVDELKNQGYDTKNLEKFTPIDSKDEGKQPTEKTIKNVVSKEELSAYAKQHKIDEKKARELLTGGGYQVE